MTGAAAGRISVREKEGRHRTRDAEPVPRR